MTTNYSETRPAAVETDVVCRECHQNVVKITFLVDGTDIGVCGCSWTSWLFQPGPDGKVYASTPWGSL